MTPCNPQKRKYPHYSSTIRYIVISQPRASLDRNTDSSSLFIINLEFSSPESCFDAQASHRFSLQQSVNSQPHYSTKHSRINRPRWAYYSSSLPSIPPYPGSFQWVVFFLRLATSSPPSSPEQSPGILEVRPRRFSSLHTR